MSPATFFMISMAANLVYSMSFEPATDFDQVSKAKLNQQIHTIL